MIEQAVFFHCRSPAPTSARRRPLRAALDSASPRASLSRRAPLLAVSCLFLGTACAPDSPRGDLLVPDRETFPLVSDALERRCATLDCHGASSRNLRLYTGTGLRLDPADIPGSGSTTDAEYDASFRSVVALEPEILAAVIAEEGASPQRLTLVRKARGDEKHAAGQILQLGDAADRCLVSWLAPELDEEACSSAADFGPPEGWPPDR